MIENPPELPFDGNALEILFDEKYSACLKKADDEYLYWNKAKYIVPKDVRPEDFWAAIKYSRRSKSRQIQFNNKYIFTFFETLFMQQSLHEFDMNFGGTLISSDTVSEKQRQSYLISSLMEEAIASSKMEGAATTRKVAKEMLIRHSKPKDKSEQMIVNNYSTIRYLSEIKNENLTPAMILEIHKRITENTLENPDDEGKFRSEDNIVVQDAVSGEIAHIPPSALEIEPFIKDLCDFANTDREFIHPIVKAIIIHFMISFLHPFADGNGRTARSLFYWFMLKKGYWITEFLSISRVIYGSKSQYEKSFLYTEIDGCDLNYFIQYNLEVLRKAFDELNIYLKRKTDEQNALLEYRNEGISERQAQILKIIEKTPKKIFIAKDFETRLGVSTKTARTDLEELVKRGFVESVPVNKRLVGYVGKPKKH